jgi:hypothetical protein
MAISRLCHNKFFNRGGGVNTPALDIELWHQ